MDDVAALLRGSLTDLALRMIQQVRQLRLRAPAPAAAGLVPAGLTPATLAPAAGVQLGTRPAAPRAQPLQVRAAFLNPEEQRYFAALEQVLAGRPYRVYPHVHLPDLFCITPASAPQAAAALGRLKDRPLTFLIVALPDHRPVVATELGCAAGQPGSPSSSVVGATCEAAGLPMLELPNGPVPGLAELAGLLAPYLRAQPLEVPLSKAQLSDAQLSDAQPPEQWPLSG